MCVKWVIFVIFFLFNVMGFFGSEFCEGCMLLEIRWWLMLSLIVWSEGIVKIVCVS